MKSIILTIIAFTITLSTAQAQFGKFLDKAKSSADQLKKIGGQEEISTDIAGGLKEALETGVKDAVNTLSADNGYFDSPYKVLLPEEAQKVISKVKLVPGFGNVEEELLAKMNAAAEIAAKEATPIFVDAIKGLSFSDSKEILFGEEDAATTYLQDSSRGKLYDVFMPVIKSSLEEVNATKYWTGVVTKYNALPFTKDVNPELDDHVNNKALDGMFSLITLKEQGIRSDVSQRTSPLLQDVFGKLDKD